MPQRLVGAGQHLARGLLDQLYPPACLICAEPTATHDTLCGACFVQLRPITAPLCPVLGVPFAVSPGEGALSPEAIADPPPFARSRAAVIYNDQAALLVSRLKYGDRPELARFCARLMASAGHEFWANAPILVPVPLHPMRQFQRRYNQSLELARALSKLTGLKLDPYLVRRVKRTRQQVGLSAEGRDRNMAGAFAANADAALRSKGKSVVLIDDVFTTGATVKAATRALKRGGIDQIEVLSFARVVSGEQIPI
ncbi:ComF family protein [Devosia sp.]|uniref:ComF family protein n=1 Tax=Devosia sp. TaxID=1871048 RepID=UPI0032678785